MSVRVDCIVPRKDATSAFIFKVSKSSFGLIIISERLQHWDGRKIISPQGLVPKYSSFSRLRTI